MESVPVCMIVCGLQLYQNRSMISLEKSSSLHHHPVKINMMLQCVCFGDIGYKVQKSAAAVKMRQAETSAKVQIRKGMVSSTQNLNFTLFCLGIP